MVTGELALSRVGEYIKLALTKDDEVHNFIMTERMTVHLILELQRLLRDHPNLIPVDFSG